ncbi:zinc-binding protein A33-like isoform X2 [Silurus meridionalis]|uniref:zinc-binding protein A33-like isoform X2 n=1 Tax=Silurus meridionalis TaxID=175797 RepID=UPI001EECCD34|nr:zinc-binding protein A33-like isoform X2 [Silurus meridionalis]
MASKFLCSQHSEKLNLFCLDDQQPVCLVCRDSRKHTNHKFRPVNEAVTDLKEELKTALNHLQEKLNTIETSKLNCSQIAEHIKNYKATVERAQCTLQHPEELSGTLIHVPKHLANLKFKVWEKMQNIVQYTNVTLDPNTAHPKLIVSNDLTLVRTSDEDQHLPNNPERFNELLCILGSEGFNSGTHCWDVKVGDSTVWVVGVMTESAQRKGKINSRSGLWYLRYYDGIYNACSTPEQSIPIKVVNKLQRIRVQLDWDKGKLSFSDPLTKTHIFTFTHAFNEKILPLINVGCKVSPMKIISLKCSVSVK